VIVPASYEMGAQGVICHALESYGPGRLVVIDPLVSCIGL